jgi:hypothetical protein
MTSACCANSGTSANKRSGWRRLTTAGATQTRRRDSAARRTRIARGRQSGSVGEEDPRPAHRQSRDSRRRPETAGESSSPDHPIVARAVTCRARDVAMTKGTVHTLRCMPAFRVRKAAFQLPPAVIVDAPHAQGSRLFAEPSLVRRASVARSSAPSRDPDRAQRGRWRSRRQPAVSVARWQEAPRSEPLFVAVVGALGVTAAGAMVDRYLRRALPLA